MSTSFDVLDSISSPQTVSSFMQTISHSGQKRTEVASKADGLRDSLSSEHFVVPPPGQRVVKPFFNPTQEGSLAKRLAIAFPANAIIDWDEMVGDWCVQYEASGDCFVRLRDGRNYLFSEARLRCLAKMVERYENTEADPYLAVWFPSLPNRSNGLFIAHLVTFGDLSDHEASHSSLVGRIVSSLGRCLFAAAMVSCISNLGLSLCLPLLWPSNHK
jgi:hypothetical protein